MPDRKAEQEKLMNAYLRRMAVCDKLRLVAEDTGNPSLEEEAKRLEGLAWQLYQQRAGRLLGAGAALREEPKVDQGLDDTLDVLSKRQPGGRPQPQASTSREMGRGEVGR